VKHSRHPPIVIYEESIDETPSQQSNKSSSNQSNTSSTYRNKDQIVWLSNSSTPTNASPTVTPKNSNDNENNKNRTRFSPAQHLRNKLKAMKKNSNNVSLASNSDASVFMFPSMSPHSAGLSPANNVSPSGKGHGSSTQQQQQQPFQIPLFHQYPEKQHFTFVIPPNTNNTSSSSSTSASTSSSEVSTTSTTINDSTALNDTKDSSTDKPDELQSNTRSKLEMLREKDTNIKPPSNQPFKKVPLQWKLDNITEEVETRCVEEVCYDEDGKKYSKKKLEDYYKYLDL